MSSERWLVITVRAPSDAQRAALAEGLFALGGTAIEENGAALTTYVAAPDDPEAWVESAQRELNASAVEPVELQWRWQADEDWSENWKRGLRARRVGKRFIVAPSWTAPEAREGDHVIVIDPEMAFGTGEHGTTRGALRFLEQITHAGDRVLDVGTGSAILAIGAAMLGATEVIAVDNDPDAILNAEDNVVRNGVADRVKLATCLVTDEYLKAAGSQRFDIIVANVLSSVLQPLLRGFHESVAAGGHVILGGILHTEAETMLEACAAAGFRVMGEDIEDEWWGVLLQRPKAAR